MTSSGMGLDKRLARLEEGQARLEERLEALSGRMRDVHRSLVGNGQPGLLDRVTRTEGKMKTVYGVMGALGVGVISLAARLLAGRD